MTITLPLSDATQANISERAARSAACAAALHILTAPCFCSDWRVWRHLDPLIDGIDFRAILAESTWSHSERLLLEYAWSLFNGGVSVDMGCLMSRLDPARQTLAIEALQRYQTIESRGGR